MEKVKNTDAQTGRGEKMRDATKHESTLFSICSIIYSAHQLIVGASAGTHAGSIKLPKFFECKSRYSN